jgi:uncharacterized protein (TIGR02147 family)
MNTLSVFQYQSGRTYLKDAIAEKKRLEADFSIRKFCKGSNFGSHAHLVMILNGRRRMTLKQVPALATGLGLTTQERIYLQTLIQLDNANSDEEKDLCKLFLNDLNPRREYRIAEIEHYHAIADWIHMAILTLAKIEGARITAEAIYPLIGEKVSIPKIREAIERLLELGLLKEETDGRLAPAFSSVKTKDDISNKGAREYHRQVGRLAVDAIEDQSPAIREFQSFALTLPSGKIDLAKEMIRKFRHQLVQILENEPGAEVYQCNLQFFKLVECPSNESKVTRDEPHSGVSRNDLP